MSSEPEGGMSCWLSGFKARERAMQMYESVPEWFAIDA